MTQPLLVTIEHSPKKTFATAADGRPLAGKRWPARYAAHRIAWHALDHTWEIEDRTEAAE